MPKVAVYARISEDATGQAAGVDRQERDCRRFARERGWQVAKVFTDNDVSASRYAKRARPAFTEMIGQLERGDLDGIVAWHLDRLYRRPAELEHLIALAERQDVTVATLHGDVDLTSGDGIVMARIVVAMAAKSSDDTSRRVLRAKDDLAAKGRPSGGARSFGFTADGMEHVDAEADLIREAVHRLLAGDSLASIARDWQARGVDQTHGGAGWTATTVRRIVTAPRIAGLRVHRGEIVGKAAWAPIVTRADFERLQARLSTRKGAPKRRSLLTGIVRCAECDQLMVRDQQYGRRVWRCRPRFNRPACGTVNIPADQLEDLVTESLFVALDGPALRRAQRGSREDTGAAKELAAAETKLNELAEMWAGGDLSRSEWLAARRTAERRADEARKRLSKDTGREAVADLHGKGAVRKAWPKLDLDRRRAILAAVIDRVTVAKGAGPGSRFDPERVDVTWRV